MIFVENFLSFMITRYLTIDNKCYPKIKFCFYMYVCMNIYKTLYIYGTFIFNSFL